MTNEEVIRQLNDLKGIGSDYVPINEALDMAIKALEAWEKVEKDIHTAIDNAALTKSLVVNTKNGISAEHANISCIMYVVRVIYTMERPAR